MNNTYIFDKLDKWTNSSKKKKNHKLPKFTQNVLENLNSSIAFNKNDLVVLKLSEKFLQAQKIS